MTITATTDEDRPVILIAEPDDAARGFLADNLAADQFHILTAAEAPAALEQLRTQPVDLIIANVDGHTLQLLDAVRDGQILFGAIPADAPLIALTADETDLQRVRLLDRGADDVITTPYSYIELRSRVAAVLRRARPRPPRPVLHAGSIRIDLHQHAVTVADQPVELSQTEYTLLVKLASDPTRVFTRAELTEHLWGCHSLRGRALDSHACRLRSKLRAAGRPVLVNVWGVGYCLLDGTAA